jgi:hypothetical protein
MIHSIVGRCHVGQSNRAVIRYLKSRFKRGAWRKMSRDARKEVMREAIRCHESNRALYHAVMTGRL